MSSPLHPAGVGPAATRRPEWTAALAGLLFCLCWVLFWYRDTALAMVTIWYRSETFAHGFIVPPIALWLIWRKRAELAAYVPRPSPWLWPLFAVLGFGWLLGQLVAVNALTQLVLVASLVLLVPALLGLPVAGAIAFPLAFMFFAVPVGDFVMPQLMDWTARFTVLALRLSGIPVFQEGLHFVIPSGRWSVVEACSGVRYLIASLTVGTLYAYLTYASPKRRWIFVGVSILVPILANWLRAYMIVMLGHLSGNTLAVGVDHLIYGWLFFGIVIMLMFMIGSRWAEPEAAPAKPVAASEAAAATGRPAWTWLALLVVLLLTAAPQLAYRQIEEGQATTEPRLAPIAEAAAWKRVAAPAVDWRPAFANPSAESAVWFASGGRLVGVYIGYYRNQGFDRKLVSSSNVLVRSSDPRWAQVAGGSRRLALGGQEIPVRTAELRGGEAGSDGHRLVVWHWYWINGRVTASDAGAKLHSALAQLLGRGDESAVVIVYAPTDQPGGAEAALADFVAAAQGSIGAALRRTGEQR